MWNERNHGNTGLDIANLMIKSHAHFIIYSLHSALVSNTGTGNGTVDTPINLVIHIYSATHSCLFPYRKEMST